MMTTFVLVHGAWHGAWTWQRLTPLLRARGFDVMTPTLTGQGDRTHLLSRDVTLSLHVTDLVEAIRSEDLADVILVAHSYAGIVATMAVDRLADRLTGVVYMDAFIPRPGTSLLDLLSPDDRARIIAAAAANDPDWLVPAAPPAGYGVWDEENAAWLAPRLGPTPLACFEEKAAFDPVAVAAVPRACLVASQTDTPRFGTFADALVGEGGTRRDVDAGHDMMLTRPESTLDALLDQTQAMLRGH